MKKVLVVLLLLFTQTLKTPAAVAGKTWYVAGNGNDANDGRSPGKPFRTLQKAADLVNPGDVVIIAAGEYTNSETESGSAVLTIARSGMPDAWITWKAKPGDKPVIKPIGWAGILVSGSYNKIDGISVIGQNDSITLLEGLNDAKKPIASARVNTNGIFFNGRVKNVNEKPHHLVVRNCEVGKCPGGGIIAIETDYITIEDCKVYENAWYMRYGGSGISTLNNWAFDDKPGYHNIIQRNVVSNNKTMVPWEKIGNLSDGNGIILDVTDLEQGAANPNADSITKANITKANSLKAQRPEWKGRTLIANNLCVHNGGSGIHTFRTKYVDIINNTTYWNGQTVGYQEIFANRSDDVVIYNNIMVPRPGGKVTSNNHNTNIKWDYNIYPVPQDVYKAEHDMMADPQFINARINALEANFKLKPGSKALNSGTANLKQPTDLEHVKRPLGKGIDRGCYEQ